METIIFTVVLLLVVCFVVNRIIAKRNQKNLQKFVLTCENFHLFHGNYYLFQKAGRFGIVDKTAKVVLDGYTNFFAVMGYGYADISVCRVLETIKCYKDKICELRDSKFRLLASGYDYFEAIYIIDRYDKLPAFYKVKRDGLFGIINHKGEVIVPCQYDNVNEKTYSDKDYSMWSSNSSVYSLKYIYFVVENKFKKGVYDKKGKQIIPCMYESIYAGGSQNNFLYCKNEQEEVVVINGKGEVIVPACSKVIDITKYGEFIRRNGKYLFTRKGKTIIESEIPIDFCEFMPKKITDGKIIYDLNGNIV